MKTRAEILAEHAREAFSVLRRTDAFTDDVSAQTKLDIITAVWQSSADRLMAEYDQAGYGVADPEQKGFGYFVEEFARSSHRLPGRNTPAAQRIADILLSEMRSGDSAMTSLSRRLYNPDMLFLSCKGQRAEIWGMAEIKSSVMAHKRRPEQIRYQEESVRNLVRIIHRDKRKNKHRAFKVDVSVAQELKKFMILPSGQKKKAKEVLPAGWDVIELEFSYRELMFLAQCLWPEFRTDAEFSGNELHRLEEGFLAELMSWWERSVGDDYPADVINDLLLFACVTGRCPVEDGDIAFVSDLMHGQEAQSAWVGECDVKELKGSTTRQEYLFMQKFRRLLNSDEEEVFQFLARIRSLRAGLASYLIESGHRIDAMPEVKIF